MTRWSSSRHYGGKVGWAPPRWKAVPADRDALNPFKWCTRRPTCILYKLFVNFSRFWFVFVFTFETDPINSLSPQDLQVRSAQTICKIYILFLYLDSFATPSYWCTQSCCANYLHVCTMVKQTTKDGVLWCWCHFRIIFCNVYLERLLCCKLMR